MENMGATKSVSTNRRHGYPVGKEVAIMSLGNRLKRLRQEKGWSQDELAFHAHIDGRQISRYENDKVTPSVDVVVKLAKAFDVSVDHLLLDDAPRRPLYEPANKLTEKIMHLENMSEEDEASLLHVVSAIEAKNKLKSLMQGIK
jgi:transcriptional regulator with XRE-family HTH domain